jgi:hypothetical protein
MITLTRLQPGMRVWFAGEPHRVVMVNESRALLEPERPVLRVFRPLTGPQAGQEIRVRTAGPRHSVSPNSELEIL